MNVPPAKASLQKRGWNRNNASKRLYYILRKLLIKMHYKLNSLFKGYALKEIKIFLVLFFIVGGVWGFIELADEVSEGSTQDFDQLVLHSIRESTDPSKPLGPYWLKVFFNDITSLGGGVVLTLLTAVIAAYFWLIKNYRSLLLVLIAAVGGGVIDLLLKGFFMRPRPDIIIRLTEVSSYSFPSGHSMMSAVIYLSLAAILVRSVAETKLRIYILSVALLLTLIIGLSRIYLGVHYPTDVLGGWFAGLSWASVCWIGAWYFEQKSTRKLKKKDSVTLMD